MSRSPTSSNLSFGLLLPQEEGPGEPPPTWAYISAAARAAEDVGFDSACLVDHMLWAEDPWERDPAEYGAEGLTGPCGAITGTPDEIAATLAGFGAVGIDELQLRLFPNTLESIEQFGPILERVRSTT